MKQDAFLKRLLGIPSGAEVGWYIFGRGSFCDYCAWHVVTFAIVLVFSENEYVIHFGANPHTKSTKVRTLQTVRWIADSSRGRAKAPCSQMICEEYGSEVTF